MRILWLPLIALLVGVNGWLLTACLVPYLGAEEPEYLLLLRPFSNLAGWCFGSLALLSLVHAVCARHVVGITAWRQALEWRGARYLSPLLLLFVPLASVAILATPMRRYAAPWLEVPWEVLRTAESVSERDLLRAGCQVLLGAGECYLERFHPRGTPTTPPEVRRVYARE